MLNIRTLPIRTININNNPDRVPAFGQSTVLSFFFFLFKSAKHIATFSTGSSSTPIKLQLLYNQCPFGQPTVEMFETYAELSIIANRWSN